jgi:hypothetical protein
LGAADPLLAALGIGYLSPVVWPRHLRTVERVGGWADRHPWLTASVPAAEFGIGIARWHVEGGAAIGVTMLLLVGGVRSASRRNGDPPVGV